MPQAKQHSPLATEAFLLLHNWSACHGRQTADRGNTLGWEALRWQNRIAGLVQKKDVWFERIFEMQIWLGPEPVCLEAHPEAPGERGRGDVRPMVTPRGQAMPTDAVGRQPRHALGRP